jgi:hypothetical protein
MTLLVGATNYLHLAQEVIKKTANNCMAKAIKKQALGRGLSALLKDPENDIKSGDKNADKVVGNIIELRHQLSR